MKWNTHTIRAICEKKHCKVNSENRVRTCTYFWSRLRYDLASPRSAIFITLSLVTKILGPFYSIINKKDGWEHRKCGIEEKVEEVVKLHLHRYRWHEIKILLDIQISAHRHQIKLNSILSTDFIFHFPKINLNSIPYQLHGNDFSQKTYRQQRTLK